MSDPFDTALAALHGAAGSVSAIYEGMNDTIRVIRSQPTEIDGAGTSRVPLDTNEFQIRRADVAKPEKGKTLTIGSDEFRITRAPQLDVEGLTWTVQTTALQ